jgi:hemoglobin-like flavoprotein
MDRIQAHRIVAVFRLFEPCGEAFVARVMLRLADRSPGVRALFPTDMSAHYPALFQTLRQIVGNLHTFSKLEPGLTRLGGELARRGVSASHLATVRVEFLATMRELAGLDWSEQIERDWDFALKAVSGALLRGAAEHRKAA